MQFILHVLYINTITMLNKQKQKSDSKIESKLCIENKLTF